MVLYTAASEDYALKHISELKLNPEFILSRKNCTVKNKSYNIDGEYYLKRLRKVKKISNLR